MIGLIHFLVASSFGLAGTQRKHSATTTLAAPPPAPPPEPEPPPEEGDVPPGLLQQAMATGFLQQLRAWSLQHLRAEAQDDSPAGLRGGLHEVSDASLLRENGTAETGRVNRTAANAFDSDQWGELRGNKGVEPGWYANVPQLHKTLNDATGLHDIYELGHYRTTTTTLWNLAPDVWWFATIPPKEVEWEHVHRAVDEIRGHKGPGFRYPPVPTTVAPEHAGMGYDIGGGAGMRPGNLTLGDGAHGHHTPLPATRHRGAVGPVNANHLKLGGHHKQPGDLTAADIWNQLQWQINNTGVKFVFNPKKSHNHTLGTWDRHRAHHKHLRNKHAGKHKNNSHALHHMRVPPTRPPVPLENFPTTTLTSTFDAYLASLEGLDRVLYMLDKLVERQRRREAGGTATAEDEAEIRRLRGLAKDLGHPGL